MGKILVTGGAGYIGSHTVVELLNSGYEVVVVDNFYNSTAETLEKIKIITKKNFEFYNGDIRDQDILEKIFKENQIDSIIHFAGLKSVGESCHEPLLYFENNIAGTLNLCKVMKKFNVKKMIFSSSATVYGMDSKAPYDEEMPTGKVSNPYGRTKFMIEEILKDLYASDNDWRIVILRYFNPIGEHESGLLFENPNGIPNNLMPYIIKVAKGELKELTVFGSDYPTPDGTCIRDYIHVVDLAKGHLQALKNALSLEGIEAFNLGTGVGVSVLEIIKTFEEVNNIKINFKLGKRREGDLPEVFAKTNKANEKLKWRTHYTLAQSVLTHQI